MAKYRMLDPGLGRWLGVDPKADYQYGLSPYNSMNNNPVTFQIQMAIVLYVWLLL
jgi:RHS repeat-associated protein